MSKNFSMYSTYDQVEKYNGLDSAPAFSPKMAKNLHKLDMKSARSYTTQTIQSAAVPGPTAQRRPLPAPSPSLVSGNSTWSASRSGTARPSRRRPTALSMRNSSHPDSVFKLPPKAVIKAVRSYRAQREAELSFSQGDFFFVIDTKGTDEDWIEVINPATKTRGIVCRRFFEDVKSGVVGEIASGTIHSAPAVVSYAASLPYPTPLSPDESGTVVHASLSRHVASTLSPTSPLSRTPAFTPIIEESTPVRGPGYSLYGTVLQVEVPDVQVDHHIKKWVFTVRLKMMDESQRVLKRTFDDFWALQQDILAAFPLEAGYSTKGRIIPYLPPHARLDEEQVQLRKLHLTSYLDRLLLTLPQNIVDSTVLDGFFLPRANDVVTTVPLLFDGSDALMDLIDDMSRLETVVDVTLLLGEETFEWGTSSKCSYRMLREQISNRLGFEYDDILYKDEAGQMIIIYGDSDVRLLFRLAHVVLFVS
ncbi:bud emergence protein 1 [Kappamyces sp. JEL0829]|nr:bud emergence protein 1 [Kappamyces sp. JEL0829]